MRELLVRIHALVRWTLRPHDGCYDFDGQLMPSPLLIMKAAMTEFHCKWLNSSAYDWAIRLALVGVLALMVFGNVSWIVHTVAASEHHMFDPAIWNIAARGSSALFVALAAATTLTRLPPVRKAAGIEPRVSALLGTFLLIALAALPRKELPPIAAALSCLFVAAGMLSSFVVLRWLGRAFSIMAEARRLITHGPYAYIRHPLYVCEELAVIGIFMQVVSPVALMILMAHGVFQVRRMLNEEQILKATFPEYENYARRTPRLIPFGWRWFGNRSLLFR